MFVILLCVLSVSGVDLNSALSFTEIIKNDHYCGGRRQC